MPTVYLESKVNSDDSIEIRIEKEYYVSLILKEIIECLNYNGIRYYSATQLNEIGGAEIAIGENIKLTFAMNSCPGPFPSEHQGVYVFFTEGDPESRRLATILSENLKKLYHDPSKVKMVSVKPLETGEESSISSIEVGIGYADNDQDIFWIRQNSEAIASNIVMSLTEYFGVPFISCVDTIWGLTNANTNIMSRPYLNSQLIDNVPANTKVQILGQWEDWYIVNSNNTPGYIQTKYINTLT